MESNSLVDQRSSPFRQTLPIEVISEIFQYADHAQLPSIALTCRRYRPEAERLLYQRIEFYECDKHARACLKALATTPQKALLVRSFWIHWRELQKKATLQLLGRALLAMKSLKMLHLRFFHNSFEPAQSVMNSFLKRCTFSLETLFLPDHLDLEGWVPQQKDLIHIGLHITRRMEADPEQLSTYKTLLQNSNPERGLTLYSITREGTHMDTVHAYPAFSHSWTAKSIAKSMAYVMPPEWITSLDLHLMNLSDHDVVGPIMASVAQYLPSIIRLRFIVRNRDIHLNPTALASSLSKMPRLAYLEVDFHDSDKAGSYRENVTRLAQTWGAECPSILGISFPDGSSWAPSRPN